MLVKAARACGTANFSDKEKDEASLVPRVRG
jgi:hypothetical protein